MAAEGDVPFGFAFAEPFEDALHLWELAVRLDAQRQGAGRALVMAVAADARARNLPAVTLTTFRDIPWNGPFYAAWASSRFRTPRRTRGWAACAPMRPRSAWTWQIAARCASPSSAAPSYRKGGA